MPRIRPRWNCGFLLAANRDDSASFVAVCFQLQDFIQDLIELDIIFLCSVNHPVAVLPHLYLISNCFHLGNSNLFVVAAESEISAQTL